MSEWVDSGCWTCGVCNTVNAGTLIDAMAGAPCRRCRTDWSKQRPAECASAIEMLADCKGAEWPIDSGPPELAVHLAACAECRAVADAWDSAEPDAVLARLPPVI